MMNVAKWVRKRAIIEPRGFFLKEGPVALSNLEFYQRMLRAVSFLHQRGIKPGDRIAVLLYNGSLFLELFFAMAHLGAILVPLNYRLAAVELNYMAESAGCALLVFDPDFREMVEEIGPGQKVEIMFPSGKDGLGELPYHGIEKSGMIPEEEANADKPLLIMYTSGTTGRPKGATLSHGCVLWNAIMHLSEGFYREKALAAAPFFHIAGLNAIATQVIHGRGCLVIQRTFDPGVALKLIERERVTCMFGAPAMLDMIARDPFFETSDLSSVRYFTAGAAPAPVNLIEKFHRKGIKIRQGFGLTETSPAVCMLHDEYALLKPGSCGKEFFHLDLKIVDDHGRDVMPGEVGEIIVKGPNVMLGYWKDPESTREALRDGWLYTGDLAKRDEDGFIFIVDRKKDLIISGGENIYPAEVEAVLLQQSQVVEAAVVGKPDEKWGEVPVAYVVLKPGLKPSARELADFCRSRIGKYKIPKEFHFVQELPRIASGKVDKKVLRQRSP